MLARNKQIAYNATAPGGGGRPLGSGRQLPPQLTVGRRPLGGRGGGPAGASGGALREGRFGGGGVPGGGSRWGDLGWEGGPGGAIWGVGGQEGGHRLPLPPLALPLTIPSP